MRSKSKSWMGRAQIHDRCKSKSWMGRAQIHDHSLLWLGVVFFVFNSTTLFNKLVINHLRLRPRGETRS